jgi:hypothetical protein
MGLNKIEADLNKNIEERKIHTNKRFMIMFM